MYGPPQDQHVPVRGFNSSEVREVLKKGELPRKWRPYFSFDEPIAYDSGVAEAGKPVKHKPVGGQANSAKSGGPWGAKRMSLPVRTHIRVMRH